MIQSALILGLAIPVMGTVLGSACVFLVGLIMLHSYSYRFFLSNDAILSLHLTSGLSFSLGFVRKES